MNSLEYWTSYFDKKTQTEEMEEIAMYAPMVKEAIKRECIFTQDEIKRRAYDLREKAERDRIGQLDYAMEKGIEKGMEKGTITYLQNILSKSNFSLSEAMDFIGVPPENRAHYEKIFSKNQ